MSAHHLCIRIAWESDTQEPGNKLERCALWKHASNRPLGCANMSQTNYDYCAGTSPLQLGEAVRLTQTKNPKFAGSFSPGGKILALEHRNPDTFWGIATVSVEGDEKSGWKVGDVKPFASAPFNQRNPAFSPDGHWLAYRFRRVGHP